jgi:hypothetical protein
VMSQGTYTKGTPRFTFRSIRDYSMSSKNSSLPEFMVHIACSLLFTAGLIGILSPANSSAQSYGVPPIVIHGGNTVGSAPHIVFPSQPTTSTNSAGFSTGYSAITSTAEKPNPIGRLFGQSETATVTTTRVVPNDLFGRPIKSGLGTYGERNSAGWNTGYSTVTSTYEKSDPLGALRGGSRTVTETTTQVVPNDAFGQPIVPLLPLAR